MKPAEVKTDNFNKLRKAKNDFQCWNWDDFFFLDQNTGIVFLLGWSVELLEKNKHGKSQQTAV